MSDISSVKRKLKQFLQLPFIKFFQWLGFQNIDYSYVHGDKSRVIIGHNCSTMNTLFNVISGIITINDNTLFGHNCMVLTGTHNFVDGKRGSLHNPPIEETPTEGRDIYIGEGCFIGSGTTIIGPVRIGDNVIITAGSIVKDDIPGTCIAAGNPAKVIKSFNTESDDE